MLICDDRRRYRAANRAVCLLLRLSQPEVVRLRIDDLTPPELTGELELWWEQLLREGTLKGTFAMLMPDGPTMLIDCSATASIAPGRHLGILLVPTTEPEPGLRDRPGAGGRLTQREREILALIAMVRSGSAIASSLGISSTTVETHVRHCLTKLDARNRARAIAIGLQHGEIDINLGPQATS